MEHRLIDRYSARRDSTCQELGQTLGFEIGPIFSFPELDSSIAALTASKIDDHDHDHSPIVTISSDTRKLSDSLCGQGYTDKCAEEGSSVPLKILEITDYLHQLMRPRIMTHERMGVFNDLSDSMRSPGSSIPWRTKTSEQMRFAEDIKIILKLLGKNSHEGLMELWRNHDRGTLDFETLLPGITLREAIGLLMPQLYLSQSTDDYWTKRRFSPADLRMFLELASSAKPSRPTILANTGISEKDIGITQRYSCVPDRARIIPVAFAGRITFLPMGLEQIKSVSFSTNQCVWIVCDSSHETKDEAIYKRGAAEEKAAKDRLERKRKEDEQLKKLALKNASALNQLGIGFLLNEGAKIVDIESQLAGFNADPQFGSQDEIPETTVLPSQSDGYKHQLQAIRYESDVDFVTAVKDLVVESGYWSPSFDELVDFLKTYSLEKQQVVLVNAFPDDKNQLHYVTLKNGQLETITVNIEGENPSFPAGTIFLVKNITNP